jgi:hypothetical protein
MSFADLISGALRPARRLILWTLTTLLARGVLSLGLLVLLTWALVNLLLGRRPQLAVRGRFEDLRRFGGAFGQGGFSREGLWPRQPVQPQEADASPAPDTPLSSRLVRPQSVSDVQARDLPPEPPRH